MYPKTSEKETVKNNPFRMAMRPLSFFFIITTVLFIVFRNKLENNGVDTTVIIIGNIILFVVSAMSIWIYGKATGHKKGHGAVTNVYSGFMLKFFTLIVAAMVYFYFAREINKPAIFICLGLYLVYNFVGVAQVIKKRH